MNITPQKRITEPQQTDIEHLNEAPCDCLSDVTMVDRDCLIKRVLKESVLYHAINDEIKISNIQADCEIL